MQNSIIEYAKFWKCVTLWNNNVYYNPTYVFQCRQFSSEEWLDEPMDKLDILILKNREYNSIKCTPVHDNRRKHSYCSVIFLYARATGCGTHPCMISKVTAV